MSTNHCCPHCGGELPPSPHPAGGGNLTKSHRQALKAAFRAPRRRYQRPTLQEEEEILALAAATANLHEISRVTGWSRDIIRRVVEKAEDLGQLWERRLAQQERYIELAWEVIMLALQAIHDGLRKGYVGGRTIDPATGEAVYFVSRVRPGEAATALLKLMKTVKLYEQSKSSLAKQLARRMTREEMIEAAERLLSEVKANKGPIEY